MNKHLGASVIAGSLLFCLSASAASPGQSASGTKSDCTPDASGKSKKDCDKINSANKSTNQKPAAKTTQAGTSSAAKAGGSNSDTKKDADKVSDERMSTRGLKPPPKDADKDKAVKPDAKSSTPPESASPK